MSEKPTKLTPDEAWEDVERFNKAAETEGIPKANEYSRLEDVEVAAGLLKESGKYSPVEHTEKTADANLPSPENLEVKTYLRPVLHPTYSLQGRREQPEFEEREVHAVRTSGMGSYAESGYIPEGQEFDPRFPTKSFPKDWFIEGGYKAVGRGDHIQPSARSGSGKVKIPAGTLWYQAGGSNSGYNHVRFWRASISGVEYEIRLPMGSRPEDLFKNYPTGSYIALPGEAGVDNPEYKQPWSHEWNVGYRKSESADTLLLLENGRWIPPLHHSMVQITKEASRRGTVEGMAKIEVSNPERRYALVREGIGKPWKITTWRDAFEKNFAQAQEISAEEFARAYGKTSKETPPPLPAIEEVLKYPERPLEGGQILFYVYRSPDGKLSASPGTTKGKGRSRKFTMLGNNVQKASGEQALNSVAPLEGESQRALTNEWWTIPEDGSVGVQMQYASGSYEEPNRVRISDIPQEAGLYAVWYKIEQDQGTGKTEPKHIFAPVSYREGGQELVAVEPYEIIKYLEEKRPFSYKYKSQQESTDHRNDIVRDALQIYETASTLRERWVVVTPDGEILSSRPSDEQNELSDEHDEK